MNTFSQKKIHISPNIQQKYCTKTSKSARFGATMRQISNSSVSLKSKESGFFVELKLGPFIHAKGMALIAFRIFLLS